MCRFAFVFLLVSSSVASAQPPVIIEAHFPGVNAQQVADLVLAPLEVHLDGTPGVARMRSLALDGHGYVRLDLATRVDPFKVRAAALERIAQAQRLLPAQASVKLLPFADDAFVMIALQPTDKTDLLALSRLAHDTLRPQLLKIPLVADIQVLGDHEERLHIKLNPARMQARNLSVADVVKRLTEANSAVGAGVIGQAPKPPKKLANPGDLIIVDGGDGKKVFLRDVAAVDNVIEKNGEAGVVLRADKKIHASSAVFLIVQMLPAGVKSVPKELDNELAKLTAKIPAGVRIEKQLLMPDDTTVAVRLPDDAKPERRMQIARAAAETALQNPHVHAGFWIVRTGESDATLHLATDTAKKIELRADVREKLDQVARVGGLTSPLLAWPGDGMQIVVRVIGEESDELRKTAGALQKRLAKVKGIVDLEPSSLMRTTLTIVIDRERCARFGVSLRTLADAIQIATDGFTLDNFAPFGKTVTVVLSGPSMKKTAADLRTLPIANDERQIVPLANLATLRNEEAPASILRENGRTCLIVSANVQGRDFVETRAEAIRIAKELSRKGVRIQVEE